MLKAIYHWLYHREEKEKADGSTEILNEFSLVPRCDMTVLECSLFKPRDDVAYTIRKLRKEMQERKTKYVIPIAFLLCSCFHHFAVYNIIYIF